ncbi:MAG: mechanosensitive ion channel [Acidobacteria bacterium]|nr:mechanosensitive ion channel [Acidobacteriota bacterium]
MDWVEKLRGWVLGLGASNETAFWVVECTQVLAVALLAWIANLITKRILLAAVKGFTQRTATTWDDKILNRGVFRRLSHLAPAMVIYSLAPLTLETSALVTAALKGAQIYMIVVGVLTIDAALNAFHDIYLTFPVSRRIPVFAYVQVVKLLMTIAALIVVVAIVIEKSPLLLLSGLGAATAILLLVFKDTILGLVAGIQLVAQDMVRPGDWIEMPKYGADGDVEEITLNVVKVRNFDKTVTTIPTYALISDSFKNWRGMQDSGGRRIKRAISIDVGSIHFLSDAQLEELKQVKKLRSYLEEKQREITAYNAEYGDAEASPANGRRMTNIGAFREYCSAYLKQHPKIRQDMTFLVRQLAPTAQGLPIELYVFTNDQRWPFYEGIQADIFDHLYAVLPLFGLRPFQQPSGGDLSNAAAALRPPAGAPSGGAA